MKVIEFFVMALRSLLANKLRSSLTMLGIIIGVGAVIALMSLGRGAEATVTAIYEDLGTNVAVLFYLREFERWLKKSPQDTMEQNEHNRPTSPAQNGEA